MKLYACESAEGKRRAYDLLALGVRRRWGLEELPEIALGERGKPYFPRYPQCHFSLSHSGSLSLCALDEQPVGADIERLRHRRVDLAGRICDSAQLAWLEAQEDRTLALYLLWTLKECRVKYTGTGLTVPLRGIGVPLPPPEEASVRLDGLLFRSLRGEGWCAAVCGHTEPEGPEWVPLAQLPRRGPERRGGGYDMQTLG